MSTLPKISAVTVSLNHAEFIRDTIESVLRQNYPNFEHIIIDGGSTDGTLDILKSYPHLKWISEPDRGQSDALNKGFARTSGDIIAWINSDDWYADGAFHAVAEALSGHSMVIGSAQEVNRDKTHRQTVPNIQRSFYDLMRHWIPYAWLAQPSVFFTKELLESVKYRDGAYVDASLYFAMDLDLWARFALKQPFTNRLDKVLSHYRIYEDNKTGARPIAGAKECARIFRRYSNVLARAERKFSCVIAVNEVQAALLGKTIAAVAEQSFTDFEIIIADYSGSPETGKALRNFAMDVNEKTDSFIVRHERVRARTLLGAYNEAVAAANSIFAVLLTQGDILAPDFLFQTSRVMSFDLTAIALLIKEDKALQNSLYDKPSNNLSAPGLFGSNYCSPKFIIRTLAFQELGGFRAPENIALSVRDLLFRLLLKGWHISIENELGLAQTGLSNAEQEEFCRVFNLCINSQLLANIEADIKADPYASIRESYGLVPRFPSQSIDAAKKILGMLPPNWYAPEFYNNKLALEKLVQTVPDFSPAWHVLGKIYEAEGDVVRGNAARERYQQLTKT